MTSHASLVFAIGLCALCALSAACFIVWLLWSLAFDLYDHLLQHHTRIKNEEIDANYRQFRVGGDVKKGWML